MQRDIEIINLNVFGVTWRPSKLLSIFALGISDKMIAQFILGLAKSAKSPADYIEKLRSTDALEINEKIISFSQELYNKVMAI